MTTPLEFVVLPKKTNLRQLARVRMHIYLQEMFPLHPRTRWQHMVCEERVDIEAQRLQDCNWHKDHAKYKDSTRRPKSAENINGSDTTNLAANVRRRDPRALQQLQSATGRRTSRWIDPDFERLGLDYDKYKCEPHFCDDR